LVGSLIAEPVSGWIGAQRLLMVTVWVCAICSFLASRAHHPWELGFSIAPIFLCVAPLEVMLAVFQQNAIADEIRGRVNGATNALRMSGESLGPLVAGVALERVDASHALVCVAFLFLMLGAVSVMLKSLKPSEIQG
jgi:MFS family permease